MQEKVGPKKQDSLDVIIADCIIEAGHIAKDETKSPSHKLVDNVGLMKSIQKRIEAIYTETRSASA